MTITFTIPGKPHAKQRPRATRKGHVYTPKETVAFERTVKQIAGPLFGEPMTGPVCLKIAARFEPPKSLSKKKTQERLWRPHTQRPDIDNVAKAIMDALNGIAYVDDAQVADSHCVKVWGTPPSTLVVVEPIAGWRLSR